MLYDVYMFQVLLKRGSSKEGLFVHAPNGAYDHDLFTLIWGPTVAALSFVFDKSSDQAIISKSISGFRLVDRHTWMLDRYIGYILCLGLSRKSSTSGGMTCHVGYV